MRHDHETYGTLRSTTLNVASSTYTPLCYGTSNKLRDTAGLLWGDEGGEQGGGRGPARGCLDRSRMGSRGRCRWTALETMPGSACHLFFSLATSFSLSLQHPDYHWARAIWAAVRQRSERSQSVLDQPRRTCEGCASVLFEDRNQRQFGVYVARSRKPGTRGLGSRCLVLPSGVLAPRPDAEPGNWEDVVRVTEFPRLLYLPQSAMLRAVPSISDPYVGSPAIRNTGGERRASRLRFLQRNTVPVWSSGFWATGSRVRTHPGLAAVRLTASRTSILHRPSRRLRHHKVLSTCMATRCPTRGSEDHRIQIALAVSRTMKAAVFESGC